MCPILGPSLLTSKKSCTRDGISRAFCNSACEDTLNHEEILEGDPRAVEDRDLVNRSAAGRMLAQDIANGHDGHPALFSQGRDMLEFANPHSLSREIRVKA